MTPQKTRRNYSHQADTLFSKLVRSRGVCEIKTDTECLGSLQCCHGFSRRYRATRWDSDNAWAGCARHHQYWTAHPIEWDDWMLRKLGMTQYASLRYRAMSGERVDPKEVLIRLKNYEAKAAQ